MVFVPSVNSEATTTRGSRPDAGIIYWIGNFRVWLLALAGVSPFLEGPEKR